MSTENQINANRQNAQKSTGPKTPEGKAKTSQNAVTHGLTSKRPVLDIEDTAEFRTFVTELIDQLDPANPLEFYFAKRAACQAWRIQRAQCYETLILNNLIKNCHSGESRNPESSLDSGLSTPDSNPDSLLGRILADDFRNHRTLEKISRYEMRLETSMIRCLDQFKKLRATEMMNFSSLSHALSSPQTKARSASDGINNDPAQNNADIEQKRNGANLPISQDTTAGVDNASHSERTCPEQCRRSEESLCALLNPGLDGIRQNEANFAPDVLLKIETKRLRDHRMFKKAV